MTDHFPNASHLAELERADRFRDLERHLQAGVQGEGAGSLQEYTRFTDVYGEATLPIFGAYDSIQRGDFPAVPRGTNGTSRNTARW